MAKEKVRYVCTNCGEISLSWVGKCPQCGAWNTLQEELVLETAAGVPAHGGHVLTPSSVSKLAARDQKRLRTGLPDVDTVLGGGIVAGSVTLIAGQPGIGKSTLLLQLAHAVAQKHKVLYVSGEE